MGTGLVLWIIAHAVIARTTANPANIPAIRHSNLRVLRLLLNGTDRFERAGGLSREVFSKRGLIGAFWEGDDDRLAREFRIIFPQFIAQPPRIHAHDRVGGSIKLRALPVKLRPQRLFFEDVASTAKRFLGYVSQEGTQTL